MKSKLPLLFLGLLSQVSSLLPNVDVSSFKQEWFTNKVDHYNYQETRTF
jgi:hypothetical protein